MAKTLSSKQQDLPHMPEGTELDKLSQAYCEKREEIQTHEKDLNKIALDIVGVMRKEKMARFCIEYDGVRYNFELKEKQEKLSVQKQKEKFQN